MDQQGTAAEPRGDAAQLDGCAVRPVDDEVAFGGAGRGHAEGARGRFEGGEDQPVEAGQPTQLRLGDEECILRTYHDGHVEVAGVVPDGATAREAAQDRCPEGARRRLVHLGGAELEAPDDDRRGITPQAQDRGGRGWVGGHVARDRFLTREVELRVALPVVGEQPPGRHAVSVPRRC